MSKCGAAFGRAAIAGTLLFLDFASANWTRRLSKSSAQFPVDEFKNELKNSFLKARGELDWGWIVKISNLLGNGTKKFFLSDRCLTFFSSSHS